MGESGCATSSGLTGSTSSTSSYPSWAATSRRAGADSLRGGARSCGRTRRRPGRSRATRTASPTRGSARACAGSSRAASTSPCDSTTAASRSSTTRRTGSRPPGEDLTAWHHRPEALTRRCGTPTTGCRRSSTSSRCIATCAGASPATRPRPHLAGVLYLFVRGMTGPATPVVDGVPCGVFTWQPSAALVEDLSDVLDQGVIA